MGDDEARARDAGRFRASRLGAALGLALGHGGAHGGDAQVRRARLAQRGQRGQLRRHGLVRGEQVRKRTAGLLELEDPHGQPLRANGRPAGLGHGGDHGLAEQPGAPGEAQVHREEGRRRGQGRAGEQRHGQLRRARGRVGRWLHGEGLVGVDGQGVDLVRQAHVVADALGGPGHGPGAGHGDGAGQRVLQAGRRGHPPQVDGHRPRARRQHGLAGARVEDGDAAQVLHARGGQLPRRGRGQRADALERVGVGPRRGVPVHRRALQCVGQGRIQRDVLALRAEEAHQRMRRGHRQAARPGARGTRGDVRAPVDGRGRDGCLWRAGGLLVRAGRQQDTGRHPSPLTQRRLQLHRHVSSTLRDGPCRGTPAGPSAPPGARTGTSGPPGASRRSALRQRARAVPSTPGAACRQVAAPNGTSAVLSTAQSPS